MAVPVLSSVAATPGPGSVTLSWNTDVAAETHVSMWLRPVKGATWDWQIGRASAIDQSGGAQVYDIDGFDKDAAAVSSLHGTNKLAIAYFSGGTAENWRSDYGSFPAGVKGPELQDWPNEYWLDIRALSTLEPIMANRASIAAAKGFDGIEWDNVDGFDQGIDIGFPVTGANQLAYNQMLARIAHQYGLFAMLKNDAAQQAALQPYFDGVITEEAKRFADDYSAFPSNNKPWYDAEYRAQDMACSTYNALGCSQIKTTLSLDNPPTIQCVTSPPAQANLAKSAPIHDTSLTTGHSKTFSGLTPGQSYGFLVWSKNASGSTYSTLLYATPSARRRGRRPGQHRRPRAQRERAGRPDVDVLDGRMDRHADAELRLSVEARRREHRGGGRRDPRGGERRSRSGAHLHRHRDERLRVGVGDVGDAHADGGPGQHRGPRARRHPRHGADALVLDGDVDRRPDADVRLPLEARGGEHRRCDRVDLRGRLGRRGPRAQVHGHGDQRAGVGGGRLQHGHAGRGHAPDEHRRARPQRQPRRRRDLDLLARGRGAAARNRVSPSSGSATA
jgi:hypothetical protein